MPDLIKLSKFISVVLRHNPEEFNIKLDEEGFTTLDALWQAIKGKYGNRYTTNNFQEVLQSPGGKQRFEVKHGRIRAMYGHSNVSVQYEGVTPPEILYHGTYPGAIAAIKREGLTSQKRQFVHLSADIDRAADVAHRRGKAIILVIRALDAHNAGLAFHHPEDKHYLVKSIPPEFIEFPEE